MKRHRLTKLIFIVGFVFNIPLAGVLNAPMAFASQLEGSNSMLMMSCHHLDKQNHKHACCENICVKCVSGSAILPVSMLLQTSEKHPAYEMTLAEKPAPFVSENPYRPPVIS